MTGSGSPVEATVTPPSPRGQLRESALTLAILDTVLARYGPRDFAVRLWDGTFVPPETGHAARFTLVLNRPGVMRRMLLPPNEIALAEAYLDNDWDLEGDMVAAMRIGDSFEEAALEVSDIARIARQVIALPRDPADSNHRNGDSGGQKAELSGAEHSRNRDRKATGHHYDVGNDFYSLFLDSRMTYTCAYFSTGAESLDAAQEAKLEHTCRKLRLKPGDRLLDIGSGWGSLIIYAAERFGVEAVGITLSQPQAEIANRRAVEAGLGERCKTLILDYRDLASIGPFDKMVSIGMVEHVGRAKWPEYFGAAWRGLKPGGLFLNHGITAAAGKKAVGSFMDRHVFQRGAFVRKYVFPDAELWPVGDMIGIAERAGFEVRDVESLREHYALTLAHWVKRLEANRQEAIRQVGERIYRVWRLYMAGCSHSFATARFSVHQTLLSKPDGAGGSHLPWTRADIYSGAVKGSNSTLVNAP